MPVHRLVAGAVFVGLVACARRGPVPVVAAETPGRVALVEWQFPTTPSPTIAVHPNQARLVEELPALRPAFYPALSDANATESDGMMERLVEHAASTDLAYVAGREDVDPPYLINISEHTPDALRAVIAAGVRIVSFSSGSTDSLGGLDAVVHEHPEVLFVVATPHISGNSRTVEEIDERPSVLATRDSNVILAGCLEFYGYSLEADRAGERLGTIENPFHVANQPIATSARQIFMMTCNSSGAFAEGFGGTSAAAPHLASLLALALEHETARGRPTTPTDLLAAIDEVTHRTLAREKSGEVHEVAYFTLDTVLVNADRPQITEQIWGDFTGAPGPRKFAE